MTKRTGKEDHAQEHSQGKWRGIHWAETSGRVECRLVNAGGCVDGGYNTNKWGQYWPGGYLDGVGEGGQKSS